MREFYMREREREREREGGMKVRESERVLYERERFI